MQCGEGWGEGIPFRSVSVSDLIGPTRGVLLPHFGKMPLPVRIRGCIFSSLILTLGRVKRGKTEHGVKRNTCIQRTIMKQGLKRTTLYCRTLRYNHQRIHACKTFGLTAYIT